MEIQQTNLEGCFLIDPTVYEDSRGLFFESYNLNELQEVLGRSIQFVQDNHSISGKGVLRGLHYQRGEMAQAKLVRVIKGEAIDIVVDLRPDSETFGHHYKTRLSATNRRILFIPRGMAHGFLALEDQTEFVYKCDNFYDAQSESGIIYNDPALNIDWEYPKDEIILSEKDRGLPGMADIKI